MICKRELDIWNLQGYKKRAGEVGQIGQLLKDCLNDHFQYNKRLSQSQALLLFHGVTKSNQKNRLHCVFLRLHTCKRTGKKRPSNPFKMNCVCLQQQENTGIKNINPTVAAEKSHRPML